LTAFAAFAGTYLGLCFEQSEISKEILLSITCGGFLFIASISIIGPVLRESSPTIIQALIELLAFCLGVGLMVGVVFLELPPDKVEM
jgi:hypothetical protein